MMKINANSLANPETQIQGLPNLGFGLGLRNKHLTPILNNWPEVDWFEIISENFMNSGEQSRYALEQIIERYPIVMHGVSLSIGSVQPLNKRYLSRLKALADDIKPVWVSDHLCWTGVLGHNTHDLLPVLLTEESLKHISHRIQIVQDLLGRPLILENPSTYLSFHQSTIAEWDFLKYLTEETGCGLLLDVNNVFLTCFHNDLDPVQYINALPQDRIIQVHLAGHKCYGTHRINTHEPEMMPQVWELFRMVWQKTGGVSTVLEWEDELPPFEEYRAELLTEKPYELLESFERTIVGNRHAESLSMISKFSSYNHY
ncbi:MAG: DUF692 domain-containing protein [Flammeovirgaceae bacterium]